MVPVRAMVFRGGAEESTFLRSSLFPGRVLQRPRTIWEAPRKNARAVRGQGGERGQGQGRS